MLEALSLLSVVEEEEEGGEDEEALQDGGRGGASKGFLTSLRDDDEYWPLPMDEDHGEEEEGEGQQQQQQASPIITPLNTTPTIHPSPSLHRLSCWHEQLPVSQPNIQWIPAQHRQCTKYGLTEDMLNFSLRGDMSGFTKWETNPIQLDRPPPFTRPVQLVTTISHRAAIKAYVGFVATCFERNPLTLCLGAYQEASVFLAFISFLKVTVVG